MSSKDASTERSQHDIGRQRTDPEERRRAIRKRRLKIAERNCENLVFFEQAHFGNVWKEQRAWTLGENAFDHEMFAILIHVFPNFALTASTYQLNSNFLLVAELLKYEILLILGKHHRLPKILELFRYHNQKH